MREADGLVVSLCPELIGRTRSHEVFIETIRRRQGAAAAPYEAPAVCAAGEPGRAAAAAGHR